MNKYQKQINKLTRHYINAKKENFKKKWHNFGIGRANGKSELAIYRTIKMICEHNLLYSNKYYRKIRRRIKKSIKISSDKYNIYPSFKMEYDCIWTKENTN